MAKLASWTNYQKKVKVKFSKVNSNQLKSIVEKNTIDVARAGVAAEALIRLLIKNKVITSKEMKIIIDKELKRAKV